VLADPSNALDGAVPASLAVAVWPTSDITTDDIVGACVGAAVGALVCALATAHHRATHTSQVGRMSRVRLLYACLYGPDMLDSQGVSAAGVVAILTVLAAVAVGSGLVALRVYMLDSGYVPPPPLRTKQRRREQKKQQKQRRITGQ